MALQTVQRVSRQLRKAMAKRPWKTEEMGAIAGRKSWKTRGAETMRADVGYLSDGTENCRDRTTVRCRRKKDEEIEATCVTLETP